MSDLISKRYKHSTGFIQIIKDISTAEIHYNNVQRILAELEMTPINENDRILDVGCGDGTFLRYLGQKGFNATGVELIEHPNHKGLEVKICDAHNLPFEDEAFNIVFSTGIYDPAMYNQDNEKLVKEILRVTASPGLYIIYDADQPNLPDIDADSGAFLLLNKRPITKTAKLSILAKLS